MTNKYNFILYRKLVLTYGPKKYRQKVCILNKKPNEKIKSKIHYKLYCNKMEDDLFPLV